jgi:hypothetical protein
MLALSSSDLQHQERPRVGCLANANETEENDRWPLHAPGQHKPAFWFQDTFGSPAQGGADNLRHILRFANGWLSRQSRWKSRDCIFRWNAEMRPDMCVWLHRLDTPTWNDITALIQLASVIQEHESKQAIVVLVSFSTSFGAGIENIDIAGISEADHNQRAAFVRTQCMQGGRLLQNFLEIHDVRDIPIEKKTYEALLLDTERCEKLDKLLARVVDSSVVVRKDVVHRRVVRKNANEKTVSRNEQDFTKQLAKAEHDPEKISKLEGVEETKD